MSLYLVYTPRDEKYVASFPKLSDAIAYCSEELEGWGAVSFFTGEREYIVWTGELLTEEEWEKVRAHARQVRNSPPEK